MNSIKLLGLYMSRLVLKMCFCMTRNVNHNIHQILNQLVEEEWTIAGHPLFSYHSKLEVDIFNSKLKIFFFLK